MLTKQQRDEWVAALRSGKYKQGLHNIKKEWSDGELKFCCIGVLYDVIDPNSWSGPFTNKTGVNFYRHRDCSTMDHPYISDEILLTRNQADVLVQLNDWEGYDFNQIANYIERTIRYVN